MNKLFINAPYTLKTPPESWSHDLAMELAWEEQYGHTLGLVDNAQYRLDVEVLIDHVQQVNPDEIILYGGLKQYSFIKEYVAAFTDQTVDVRGFPHDLNLDIPLQVVSYEVAESEKLPAPAWKYLPLVEYFSQSSLPCNMESSTATRRGSYKTHWSGKTQSPTEVADTLRYLKLLYNYDFLHFEEDFTQDLPRTYAILTQLEEYQLSGLFHWTCQADPTKLDREFTATIKKAGCSIVDLGVIDIIKCRDMAYLARLEVAAHLIHAKEMTPYLWVTLGDPDTQPEDLLAMLDFIHSTDIWSGFTLAKPYPGTPQFEQIEKYIVDLDSHLLALNTSFVNYTHWSHAEFVGILALLQHNERDKIKALI